VTLRPSRQGGSNFAVGGARTAELRGQVVEFLRRGEPPGYDPKRPIVQPALVAAALAVGKPRT
jgi:hypothetical protein